MAKKVAKICKLQFAAGGAKPGPALASAGINMPKFCTEFNDKTKDRKGDIVPVIITAYEDKTFDFIIKTTPAAVLLKKQQDGEAGNHPDDRRRPQQTEYHHQQRSQKVLR